MPIKYAWKTLRTLGRNAKSEYREAMRRTAPRDGGTTAQRAARNIRKHKLASGWAAGVALKEVVEELTPFENRPRASGGYRTPTPDGNFASKQRESCLAAQAENGHVDPTATDDELAYFYKD